jgi:hypothetical protein
MKKSYILPCDIVLHGKVVGGINIIHLIRIQRIEPLFNLLKNVEYIVIELRFHFLKPFTNNDSIIT